MLISFDFMVMYNICAFIIKITHLAELFEYEKRKPTFNSNHISDESPIAGNLKYDEPLNEGTFVEDSTNYIYTV